MWILPKQLHTSDFVPDIAALNLDLNESSQLCAQSLFVRSKPSRVPTWLRKWKRDTWTQHLFGRILNPSHGQTFVTAWTSLLVVTPASHSAPQEIDSAKTIPATSGPLSQMEFDFCAPSFASLKTSTATSALDSEKLSKNWKNLVTQRRGEYLARAKSARHTDVNGSSSWPTPNCPSPHDSNISAGSLAHLPRQRGIKHVLVELMSVPVIPASQSQKVRTPESWPTPTASECLDQGTSWEKLARVDKGGRILRRIAHYSLNGWPPQLGQPVQTPTSTSGSPPESWATPRANKTEGNSSPEFRPTLHQQVTRWPTPRAEMDSGAHRGKPDTLHSQMKTKSNGKLNPRWVETLMGLPVGWTMPSCTSLVIIAPTNSDSLGTG